MSKWHCLFVLVFFITHTWLQMCVVTYTAYTTGIIDKLTEHSNKMKVKIYKLPSKRIYPIALPASTNLSPSSISPIMNELCSVSADTSGTITCLASFFLPHL